MAQKIEVIEESTMRWPDGVDRTFIKLRKPNKQWGFDWKKYRTMLVAELERLGARGSVVICRAADERMDPGVAVWFSLKKEDFGWQQGLGLDNPAPRLEEIETAFRDKAKKCHPDAAGGGEPELFKKLNEWRNQAKAWVTGTHGHQHEMVMAIDAYTEPRLNLCALRLAFSYIRGLERVGAPAIVSQTLGAFRAKLTGGTNVVSANS